MTMKRLRATREVYYASKTHPEGAEFDAHESDAKLLVGLEKAAYVEPVTSTVAPKPAATQPARKLVDRAMKADEPTAVAPQATSQEETPPEGQRNRRYLRRDMTPEE